MTLALEPTAISLHPPAAGRTGPAAPLTRFVGRAHELAELERLLGGTRLLTLTGAGGSGKTRLAHELAARVAPRRRDGVIWLELAALDDPAMVAPRLAHVLGVGDDRTRPAAELVRRALRDRDALLVLDNCEHLVDACAALVDALLRDCPALVVLATSREALGVAGERAWLVPPLSLPAREAVAMEDATRSEAVQLFVERAQEATASFALAERNAAVVAAICRRLDGLPLGIELAAARVRVLPPEQLLARLEDSFGVLGARTRGVPTRHQTLRATVDWSYQLLSPAERLLLQRLAVFAGGCTLDAVEAVCADERLPAAEVLDVLASLVDKSLVAMRERDGGARYLLLEIVRQYARDRLAEDAAAARLVHGRHADYFLAIAHEAEPHLLRMSDADLVDRLHADHDNFRAALAWLAGPDGDAGRAAELAGALWMYVSQLGAWTECAAWIDTALAALPDRAPTPALARLLHGASSCAYLLNDLPAAVRLMEQALAICEHFETPEHAVVAHARLAFVVATLGDRARARQVGDAALERARASGVPWLLAFAQNTAGGWTDWRRGDFAAAHAHFVAALVAARDAGYPWGVNDAQRGQAWSALARGDVPGGAAHAADALRSSLALREPLAVMRSLVVASAVALETGEPRRAASLLGALDAIMRRRSLVLPTPEQARHGRMVEGARAALEGEPGAFEAAWRAGAGMSAEALAALVMPTAPAAVPASVAAAPAPPSNSAAEAPAPAFEVTTLGALAVLRDGLPIPGDAWQYARIRELFLHLLMHPEGRTREQIGVVFWPEATAAQLKNNFHVTVHHARKALGRADAIVLDGDRYAINWGIGVEVDARRFEEEARAALRMPAGPARLEALERALARYQGDFLDGCTVGDWHLEHRDRLQRLFGDAVLALGAALDAAGRHREAAGAYRRLVDRDPLHEDAVRRLMESLARAGERAQALRHYERLATLLRMDLECDPEPDTVALARRLRGA